jgi:hypothetical protein
MTENHELDSLDQVVGETLAYFEGTGRVAPNRQVGRIDEWGAKEVLIHFLYFHEATAWGILSTSVGGPVWTVPADWDKINEISVLLHKDESVDDLILQLRSSHDRLRRAVATVVDLDQPVMKRPNGKFATAHERLERIKRHWEEHLEELRSLDS